MAAPPEVIAAAREYFNQGYQVVAVRADKRPWGKDWRRAHSLDEVIKLLAGSDCPAIGFLGGELNHWIVPVDFDTVEGDEWFRSNCRLAGIDPDDFPTVITPGKRRPDGSRTPGLHRYMTDIRQCLGNATGPLLKKLGIDIRGAGHAMLPPSPHPDDGHYAWAPRHSLADFGGTPIPPVPDFLYDAIEARQEPAEPAQGNGADPGAEATFRAPPPPGSGAGASQGQSRAEAYCRAALAGAKDRLATAPKGRRNMELNNEALGLGHLAHFGVFTEGHALSALMAACTSNGLLADSGVKACHATFDSGWKKGLLEPKELPPDPPRPSFGAYQPPEWPRTVYRQIHGAEKTESDQENQSESEAKTEAPLQSFTPQAWADRDIPPADFLLGDLFSTTSRVMIGGPTGLGKTQLALMWAFAMAAGSDFLHWSARRAARVLYLDGEMSRRLAKERIVGAIQRFGSAPDNLVFISKEDFETMPPLNSEAGQAFVDALIGQYGPFDFIVIDNIQAWCPGDLKSPESWALVLPWIRQLTKRSIGQLWIHHTGHENDRLYGDKSKEWQLDTVGLMIKPEEPAPERVIEFILDFTKARERSPANRSDFDPVAIWLDQDEGWQSDRGRVLRAKRPRKDAAKPQKPAPLDSKFHNALIRALGSEQAEATAETGRQSTTIKNWQAACEEMGLLDKDKPGSAKVLFYRHKRNLIALEWIIISGDLVSSIRQETSDE